MKTPVIRPCGDYVLLKREPKETITASGIIIPTDADPRGGAASLRKGEVLAVGPGRWADNGLERVPMSVKPGDVVWFSPVFKGQEDKKGISSSLQAEQLILRDGDVWCVEEKS